MYTPMQGEEHPRAFHMGVTTPGSSTDRVLAMNDHWKSNIKEVNFQKAISTGMFSFLPVFHSFLWSTICKQQTLTDAFIFL